MDMGIEHHLGHSADGRRGGNSDWVGSHVFRYGLVRERIGFKNLPGGAEARFALVTRLSRPSVLRPMHEVRGGQDADAPSAGVDYRCAADSRLGEEPCG